jgi:7-keto-8-aminopelargonate synthetase-like enzyme
LINYARPLIYTTSMSFPSLAAIKVVYSLMKRGETEAVSELSAPFCSPSSVRLTNLDVSAHNPSF